MDNFTILLGVTFNKDPCNRDAHFELWLYVEENQLNILHPMCL